MSARLFAFVGGAAGPWCVLRTETLVGESLPDTERLDIVSSPDLSTGSTARWTLRGITSNERYVVREEKGRLVSAQQGLG